MTGAALLPAPLRSFAGRLMRRLADRRRPRANSVPANWLDGPPPVAGREVCLFVTYAPDGRIGEHHSFHMKAWHDQGFLVVAIVALDDPRQFDRSQDLSFADAVLLRENRGHDFGAWASAIARLPSLGEASRVVTVNDSVYGPFSNFPAFVDRLRNSPADVTGAVESLERGRHFQSFLLGFAPRALNSRIFRQFWRNIRIGDRDYVITHHELPLVRRMEAAGLSTAAVFPVEGDAVRAPTSHDWKRLIERGFPYVKRQLLRDNPVGVDIHDWRDVMARHGFDPAIAERHLHNDRCA